MYGYIVPEIGGFETEFSLARFGGGAESDSFSQAFEVYAGVAFGAAGGAGVSNLLDLFEKEMRVAMTLTGAKSIQEITSDCLVKLDHELRG